MELDILDENLLSRPGNTLVEIETDSEDSDSEKKEELSDGLHDKIKIPDIIQSIEAKFAVKPSFSSRPFFNGDEVCFRPEKTCKWMRGKIEMKVPGVEEGQQDLYTISEVSEDGGTCRVYKVLDERALIKSNNQSPEVLNNLDQAAAPSKRVLTGPKGKGKSAVVSKEKDPPSRPKSKVSQVPDVKSNCEQISKIEQLNNKNIKERISRMFLDNKADPPGGEEASLKVMMRSFSDLQLESLALSVADNFVSLSSNEFSAKVRLEL